VGKVVKIFLTYNSTMSESQKIPTLYEWAGGMATFEKLMDVFYKKVLEDPLLKPVFIHMSPQHQKHVAYFIAEVFGGPAYYSGSDGSHFKMIQKHLGKHITEPLRRKWVELLILSADEVDLPADPEFRSAFMAYIEWGTRLAVINSNASDLKLNPEEAMPKWGWGVPGGPYLT
jgi:hemoglobin